MVTGKSVCGLAISICILLIYVSLYCGTTDVRPQGYGGLSGPQKVRVFASEFHLSAFYPLYLVERWIRNESFTSSSSLFNVDFKDGCYAHWWLYDDGKYGEVWYADPRDSVSFLVVTVLLSLGAWKLIRLPAVFSVVFGFVCALLLAFAIFSVQAEHFWAEEDDLLMAGHPEKALMIAVTTPEKQHTEHYVLRVHSDISWGDSTHWFSSRVWGDSARGFRVLFQMEQKGSNPDVKAIRFPYDSVTKTNWQGVMIEGSFQ